MDLDAFRKIQVVDFSKNKYKITSIYAHREKLLLGLSDGSLQVYSVDGSSPRSLKTTLISTYRDISKRSIDLISAVRDAGILTILSDGVVSILDVETFSLDEILNKTRGAVTLATCENVRELSANVSAVVSRLIVSCKRCLVCYEWRDSELYQYKEIPLSDTARNLSITRDGDHVICGLYSDYVIVDVPGGKISKPIVPGFHHTPTNDHQAPSSSSFFSFAGRQSNLLSCQLLGDENILVHETLYQFISSEGQFLAEKQVIPLEFEQAPQKLGFSYPFFICINSKGVEVRNPDNLTCLQWFDLPHIHSANFGKSLYVATDKQVYRLLSCDFKILIDELESRQGYMEAISLLTLIEPALFPEKQEVLRKLQFKRATQLFRDKKYDESLTLFSDASAPPDMVIGLFPAEISGVEAGIEPDEETPDEDTSSHESRSDFVRSVRLLLPFLAQTRRKISKLMTSDEKVHYQGYELAPDIYGDLDRAANLVDTCLFKCYMLVTPALVGPLVRLHNHCNAEVVREMLSESRRWNELIDFYRGKNMHREALNLLSDLANSDEQFNGPEPTVRYLQRLNNDYLDIILEYMKWPMEIDAMKFGVEIFIQDSSDSLSLSRRRVLKFLASNNNWDDLTIKYLKFIIEDQADDLTLFHNNLALLYMKHLERYGVEMLAFLNHEPYYYSPERILQQIRSFSELNDILIEAKAIIYGKIGDHKEALELYAMKLKDYDKARTYCSEIYEKDQSIGVETLKILFTIYLKESPTESRQQVLDLLASQGSRMSVMDVITQLPDSTKVGDVSKFLESQLRQLTSTADDEMLASALLKVHLVKSQQHLLELGQRYTVITAFKTCEFCLRRLGNSIISIFPDGIVVHYGCSSAYRKRQEENEKRRQGVLGGEVVKG